MNFSDIKYNQNWNVGFFTSSLKEVVEGKPYSRVQWMKHSYTDRWFADPFIYKVTDTEIVLFVEECPIHHPKGIICELVVDKTTNELKNRYVLLEKDTHLSYPSIIRYKGKTYVYPENGASGELNIYEYDKVAHQLINPVCILKKPVADATIVLKDGCYYMITTHVPNVQERAFLYKSDNLFGPYLPIGNHAVQLSRSCSRPGGQFFSVNEKMYRPAQNCVGRYGKGLNIMQVSIDNDSFKEDIIREWSPLSFNYNLGLHTLNHYEDTFVIDGYGYLFPYAGRIMNLFRIIKHRLYAK